MHCIIRFLYQKWRFQILYCLYILQLYTVFKIYIFLIYSTFKMFSRCSLFWVDKKAKHDMHIIIFNKFVTKKHCFEIISIEQIWTNTLIGSLWFGFSLTIYHNEFSFKHRCIYINIHNFWGTFMFLVGHVNCSCMKYIL